MQNANYQNYIMIYIFLINLKVFQKQLFILIALVIKSLKLCVIGISINQDKKPPSVLPKTYKKIKLVGQPLPGMAHSNSLPESFGRNGEEAVTVQVMGLHDFLA